MTAATVYLAASLAGIVLLLALGRLINPPAWWALPDPHDRGGPVPLWLCPCGRWVEWVWDCPACGHAPPWGCHDETCPRHGPDPNVRVVWEWDLDAEAPPDPDALDDATIDALIEEDQWR